MDGSRSQTRLKGPSGPECSSAQDLDLLLLSSLRTLVVWHFWNPHAFLLGGYEIFFLWFSHATEKFWSKIGSPNTCEAMGKRVKAMPFHSKASKSSKPEPRNMRDKTRRSVMTGLNGLKAPAVSQLEKMQFDKSLFTPLLL